MPLKNVDKANPELTEYWLQIISAGVVDRFFETQRQAANIRSQMGVLRTLMREQAPDTYRLFEGYALSTEPYAGGYVIKGKKPMTLSALGLMPGGSGIAPQVPHHHNPLGLTPTGFPMPMPEVLPLAEPMPEESEEERKKREAAEFKAKNDALMAKMFPHLQMSQKDQLRFLAANGGEETLTDLNK